MKQQQRQQKLLKKVSFNPKEEVESNLIFNL
jgi:hypothetical protein